MYDPVSTDMKAKDPELNKLEKKHSELSSRYHGYLWAQEDYDNRKGKGSFAKKFPDDAKKINELLDEKTSMKLAIERYRERKSDGEETKVTDSVAPASVPVQ